MSYPKNILQYLRGYTWIWLLNVFLLHALATVQAAQFIEESPSNQTQLQCFTIEEVQEVATGEGVDIAEFNLTESICLPLASRAQRLQEANHNGIPDGVVCESQTWCDSQGMCTRVCKRGSVQIDKWYQWASEWQRNASKNKPLCHASLLGSHNSAITLADGYGNQDLYWQSFLEYLPNLGTKPLLRTNNQWLSVTDQLNLGVRVVEVDTHWFEGGLRAAHCGGLHAKALNQFIGLLNSISKLTGNRIRWDTETIGCSPSLSSIPVRDQRLVSAVLQEIVAWLRVPANADEFLIIFFDDEKDIVKWGKVANLLQLIRDAFPRGWLYTPVDKKRAGAHTWPSIAEIRASGARLVLVNRRDYGAAADELIFRKEHVCGWFEPALWELEAPPGCSTIFKHHSHPQDGGFSRINDCQLVYGPLNCNFMPRSSADRRQQFSPATIQSTAMCGWNCISPDWLTPDLAHSTIWSWAPDEPRTLGLSSHVVAATETAPLVPTVAGEGTRGTEMRRGAVTQSAEGQAGGAGEAQGIRAGAAERRVGAAEVAATGACVAMSALDGRWRSVSCDNALPIACKAWPAKAQHANASNVWESASGTAASGRPVWHLGCASVYSQAAGWSCDGRVGAAQSLLGGGLKVVGSGRGGGLGGGGDVRWEGAQCAPGFAVAYPHNAWENVALWKALAEAGEARVMLPLRI
eukprot:jgi/Ulvmu1/11638/UM008_0042.1